MEVLKGSCSMKLSREKFGVLIKGEENQLTMICGNWQDVLLECAYTSHSVTLSAFNSKKKRKKKKKKSIIMFITFLPTQSERDRSQLDSFSLTQDMTLGKITPNYFCWLIWKRGNIHIMSCTSALPSSAVTRRLLHSYSRLVQMRAQVNVQQQKKYYSCTSVRQILKRMQIFRFL